MSAIVPVPFGASAGASAARGAIHPNEEEVVPGIPT